jgi:hypothetical protein
MQSKKFSLIESVTNTIVGFMVSLLIQLAIYPLLKIPVTITQNLLITSIFTIASILRGYILRRIFNKIR